MRSGTDRTTDPLAPLSAGSEIDMQPMAVVSSSAQQPHVVGQDVPYHPVNGHHALAPIPPSDGLDDEAEIEDLEGEEEHEEQADENANLIPEQSIGLTQVTPDQAEAELHDLRRLDWVKTLLALSPLPEKYDWSPKEVAQLVTALYCTAAASILYYEGSKQLGTPYIVGSLIVNGLQTAYYTKETFGYVSKISENKPLAAFASVLAGCATLVTTIATYQLSVLGGSSSTWAVVKSLLNASGNLPQNLYGMFASLEIIKKYFENNQQARDDLHTKLRFVLRKYKPLQHAMRRDRSSVNKVINHLVGVGFGVLLSAGQLGYMRSSVAGVTKVFGNEGVGLTLGLLTNMPSIAISLFISGNNISTGVVNKAFDIANNFADKYKGEFTPTLSRREKMFLMLSFLTFSALIVLARFSGATSLYLYESEPPLPDVPSDDFIDGFERIDVDEGAQLFNAIMSIMAMNAILTYFKEAYVRFTTVDYYEYRVSHMDHAIDAISTKKVEEIAEEAGCNVTPVVPFWVRYGLYPAAPAAPAAPNNVADENHFAVLSSDDEKDDDEQEMLDVQEPGPVAAGYGMLHH